MPLYKRVRIEVFIPDLPNPAYQQLLRELANELTYTFGGCTISSNRGQYLSALGMIIPDPVHILFTDTALRLEQDRQALARYLREVKDSVVEALSSEEAVLITAYPVYHAE